MVLIEARKGNQVIGRCDASCYAASPPKPSRKCKCICGGKNHGVGIANAIDNTNELKDYISFIHKDAKIRFPEQQLELFKEFTDKGGYGYGC